LRLEIDLDLLADEVATRVAARLADRIAPQASSPWMAMEEAIAYTRIPAGTFRKLVADGRLPAHGGRRKIRVTESRIGGHRIDRHLTYRQYLRHAWVG
jgi:excisionase family DNA binding protein